jgi:hypothetical protein
MNVEIRSAKKRLKRSKDFDSDIIQDISEDWQDESIGQKAVAKGNCHGGNVEIHLHCSIRVLGPAGAGPAGYHCFVFDSPCPQQCEGAIEFAVTDIATGGTGCTYVKNPVLVNVGEFAESPERVILEFGTELVRLNALYEALRQRADLPYHFEHRSVLEQGGALPSDSFRVFIPHDRELRISLLNLRQRRRVPQGQCVGDLVETVADILNDVTDEERKRCGGNIVCSNSPDRIRRTVRVNRDLVGKMLISFEPGSNFSIQAFEVHTRPVGFEHMVRHADPFADWRSLLSAVLTPGEPQS